MHWTMPTCVLTASRRLPKHQKAKASSCSEALSVTAVGVESPEPKLHLLPLLLASRASSNVHPPFAPCPKVSSLFESAPDSSDNRASSLTTHSSSFKLGSSTKKD